VTSPREVVIGLALFAPQALELPLLVSVDRLLDQVPQHI
jgi:hypothetical protein